MSFRGGRLVNGEPGEHAYRCVRAAIDTVRRIQTLADPHFRAVKVGGASMDDGLIGTFGTSRRLSYTILGDRVNLAARLESSCNALGVSTLFCHATYELTRDRKDIAWRKLGHLRVKGKVAPEPVYEAMDAGDGGEWLRGFNAGMDAFLRRDFGAAHHAFVSVQTLRPGGDVPSQVYAQRSETLLSKPTPSDIDLTLPFDPPPVASA